MRRGTINCKCGQIFYFESASELPQPTIKCPKCEGLHDISNYPDNETEIENPIEVEDEKEIGEEDGTNI